MRKVGVGFSFKGMPFFFKSVQWNSRYDDFPGTFSAFFQVPSHSEKWGMCSPTESPFAHRGRTNFHNFLNIKKKSFFYSIYFVSGTVLSAMNAQTLRLVHD